MSELPKGWITVCLREIISKSKEKIEPDKTPNSYYLSLEHVEANTRRIISKGTAREVHSTKAVFCAGDVLYGKLRPYLNKVCIPDFDGVCSTDFLVFKDSGVVDQRFLMYLLNRRETVQYAHHLSAGVQLPRIGTDDLGTLEVPLAPLNEQKRIVAKLDELLPKVEACKQRLEKIPTILKRFRQSVLAAAVSGKLTEEWRSRNPDESALELYSLIKSGLVGEKVPLVDDEAEEKLVELKDEVPPSWVVCQVGNVSRVMLGGTPSRKEPTYWNGDIPWISSGEVNNCEISVTEERITTVGLENSNAKMLQPGTILVAMIGEGKTRGQSAILRIVATSNQNAAALVFDQNLIVPEYVFLWMLFRYEATRSIGRGGNQPALNGEKVRQLPFVLPPMGEQREIVSIVHSQLGLIAGLEAKIQHSLSFLQRTNESILAQAFSGMLVSQDPKDESASTLLERLRASSVTSTNGSKPKSTRKTKKKDASA